MSQLAGVSIGETAPVRVMGVLNVSPESFYGGSVHTSLDRLVAAAETQVSEGADIIDLGAMSTAPYLKTHISEAEEIDRLAQAIEAIAARIPIPISADTKRAPVARAALTAGAQIINDVSGLKNDTAMADLIAQSGAGVIIMASELSPGTGSPLARVTTALSESVQIATRLGIPHDRIVLDPGIGFFRQPEISWHEWDCTVLRELRHFRAFGLPILVGASRKSFIGKITDEPDTANRLAGSLACATIAVSNGAHIIRAHDVKETRQAVRMAERLRPLSPESPPTTPQPNQR
jgi:dihydropteroate synthase